MTVIDGETTVIATGLDEDVALDTAASIRQSLGVVQQTTPFEEIGVWYALQSAGGAGRTWMLPTTDDDEARKMFVEMWGEVPDCLYFEGTLDDHLDAVFRGEAICLAS